MSSNLIVIDGKTYNSVNEMPPDVRAKYEQAMKSVKDKGLNGFPSQFENAGNIFKDQDGNGIPDLFEGAASTQISTTSTRIVVNGKEYGSIEELPPDARARYEQAMSNMDKNQNGIPDFAEGMFAKVQQTPTQRSYTATPMQTSTPMDNLSAISPDTSNGWRLVLFVGFVLFACAIGGAAIWYLFLR